MNIVRLLPVILSGILLAAQFFRALMLVMARQAVGRSWMKMAIILAHTFRLRRRAARP
jgi:hypothetical protein